jgi:hypothetical protein
MVIRNVKPRIMFIDHQYQDRAVGRQFHNQQIKLKQNNNRKMRYDKQGMCKSIDIESFKEVTLD